MGREKRQVVCHRESEEGRWKKEREEEVELEEEAERKRRRSTRRPEETSLESKSALSRWLPRSRGLP